MWKLDVINDGLLWVPLGIYRIGGSKDGCTGIQGANNTSLSNGEGLLLLMREMEKTKLSNLVMDL